MKFKKFINSSHTGAIAVEGMILTPLMFGTMIMLLYLFFMFVSYILYSNIANSMAQELNMRQTGYKTAMNNYATLPSIKTNMFIGGEDTHLKTLTASAVKVNPETQALRSGTYFALDQYFNGTGMSTMPYTQMVGVYVESSKPINVTSTTQARDLVGAVIKVEISYKSFISTSMGRNPTGHRTRQTFTLKAAGYNIIS